jgi:uncharacterized membrane protein YfcA
LAELTLIPFAFLTSLTAAIGGIAGGVILISVMPGFLPAEALIPVHGIVQIASNVSRAAFGIRHIDWRIFRTYAAGAVVGALLGSQIVPYISWDNMPLILGAFILLFTWIPRIGSAPDLPGKFAILGMFQTSLSLFIGIAGPLNMPFLLRENLGRDRTVITHSVQMTTMHLLKVITLGVLGFAFGPYLGLTAGMVAAATAGSWLGTKLRGKIPEEVFRIGIKILITILGVRMILRSTILPELP